MVVAYSDRLGTEMSSKFTSPELFIPFVISPVIRGEVF